MSVGCNDFLDHLDVLLDGHAPLALRLELEAHVHGCPHCRQVMVACRETISIYRGQDAPQLAAAVHDRVMASISRQGKSAR